MVLGRVNAHSQRLHNSVQNLRFSGVAEFLGKRWGEPSYRKIQWDHPPVNVRLLLNAQCSYTVGKKKEKGGEDDQDLELCPS